MDNDDISLGKPVPAMLERALRSYQMLILPEKKWQPPARLRIQVEHLPDVFNIRIVNVRADDDGLSSSYEELSDAITHGSCRSLQRRRRHRSAWWLLLA
jgi:hypothetical protein